ncbi:MAG: hypothetical protein GWP91_04375 [Rhodobacterales bacterium]|nr:hypothetical protein [Rhodobacterales bacterium]
MRTSNRILASVLLLLSACGDGGAAPDAARAKPVEVLEEAPPSLPDIDCPEGANYVHTELDGSYEQSCEVSGAKTGPFRRWHNLDTKAVDGGYVLGLPEDTWIWSYPSGAKKTKGAYRRGKERGSWTWWYESGQKSEEGDFLSGRKAGQWIRWYESGKKMEAGLYQNGTKNGVWKYYRDDGTNTVSHQEQWQKGKMKEEKFLNEAGKEIPEPEEEVEEAKDQE